MYSLEQGNFFSQLKLNDQENFLPQSAFAKIHYNQENSGLCVTIQQDTFLVENNSFSRHHITSFEFYAATVDLMEKIKFEAVEKLEDLSVFEETFKKLISKDYYNCSSDDLYLEKQKKLLTCEERGKMFEKIFNKLYTRMFFDDSKILAFSRIAFFYFLQHYKDCREIHFDQYPLLDHLKYEDLTSSFSFNDFIFHFDLLKTNLKIKHLFGLEFEKEKLRFGLNKFELI